MFAIILSSVFMASAGQVAPAFPWGAKRDELNQSVARAHSTGPDTRPDKEGLVLGGEAPLPLPDGSSVRLMLYFTPLSQELARVNFAAPGEKCSPLLSEFRLAFGRGVEESVPQISSTWTFADIRTNTRWAFKVYYHPGTPNILLCGVEGHPLSGTQISP